VYPLFFLLGNGRSLTSSLAKKKVGRKKKGFIFFSHCKKKKRKNVLHFSLCHGRKRLSNEERRGRGERGGGCALYFTNAKEEERKEEILSSLPSQRYSGERGEE